jgi:hypothetical protein
MTQLVRHHAGQLRQRQADGQRQSKGQDQVLPEQAGQAATEAGRGVDGAIDGDLMGLGRSHGLSNAGDEGVQHRLSPSLQHALAAGFGRAREQRLDLKKTRITPEISGPPMKKTMSKGERIPLARSGTLLAK